ncbi:MAG: hypothetical protein ABJL44_19115 [Algibacter sp.]
MNKLFFLSFMISHMAFAQITETGDNVGIGTTTPSEKLDVNGSASISGNIVIDRPYKQFLFHVKGISGADRLYIAPKNNGSWDWAKQLEYKDNGDFIVNGNVGVSTNTPSEKLQVTGNISSYEGDIYLNNSTANQEDSGAIRWNEYGENSINKSGAFIKYNGSDNYLQFMTNTETTDFEHLRIYRGGNLSLQPNSGNVGIGTNDPKAKLDIVKNSSTDAVGLRLTNSGWSSNMSTSLEFKTGSYKTVATSKISSIMNGSGNAGDRLGFFVQDNSTINPNNNPLVEKLSLLPNGDVGIGTTNPDAKLAVKGDIHTQEVKVDLLGAVMPDYVFYKDYKLKTLTEVEQYINEKGHLPNIPSAKDAETNGLLLKEMNLKLLEKIEELTLYTIQQEKEIKTLKKDVDKVEVLEDRLLQIETFLQKTK